MQQPSRGGRARCGGALHGISAAAEAPGHLAPSDELQPRTCATRSLRLLRTHLQQWVANEAMRSDHVGPLGCPQPPPWHGGRGRGGSGGSSYEAVATQARSRGSGGDEVTRHTAHSVVQRHRPPLHLSICARIELARRRHAATASRGRGRGRGKGRRVGREGGQPFSRVACGGRDGTCKGLKFRAAGAGGS